MRDKSASDSTSLTTAAALDSPSAYAALMRWANARLSTCCNASELPPPEYLRMTSPSALAFGLALCHRVRALPLSSSSSELLRAKAYGKG